MILDVDQYRLNEPESLLTPCLLVYPDLIRRNLQEAIRIVGDVERLRPHVKTHKCANIVKLELDAGITKHKCATLMEAQMLAQCGAPDVLLAYQPVGPSADVFARIVSDFPKTQFSTVIEDLSAASRLDAELAKHKVTVDALIDVDSGMHRTGIPAGQGAIDLFNAVSSLPNLNCVGLHVYDGHNHQPSLEERESSVAQLMRPVEKMIQLLNADQPRVQRVLCGGTPTFPIFAERSFQDSELLVECSPGTCVLSDFNYGTAYQDLSSFVNAAVLMTRVVSKQHAQQVTVDLGNKAVAADPPAGSRCHFLGDLEAKEVKQNEEHLMLQTPHADQLQVGDVLYALPAHICPTVALHSHIHAVKDGAVQESWPVTARNRIYQVN